MADSARILLVEDDPASAEMTVKILQNFAILNHVDTARTGREAIEFLRYSPDIVLLDWRLPDISGEEVLVAARQANAIVVVLSSHKPEAMNMSRDNSPDYYISKPLDSMQFLMVLRSAGKFGLDIVRTPE